VRDLLARAGLSQRQGARELGVDERTMRYWCAGDHDPPRMAILALEVERYDRTSKTDRYNMANAESAEYTFVVKEDSTGRNPFITLEPLGKGIKSFGNCLLTLQLEPGTSLDKAQEVAEYLRQHVQRIGYQRF
jgi:transcriptional regulator with XRE-family HTH domain